MENPGIPCADGVPIALTKNLTLYTQWTPTWTVSFDVNGGEGNMPALPVARGQCATLPADIERIGKSAFKGIAATVVDIPEGCASIGDHAFKDCLSLTQIRVPMA